MATLTKAQRRLTAYHEAGHAVVGWRLGASLAVATIRPGNTNGRRSYGHVRFASWGAGHEDARIRVERMLIVSFAGPAAQRIHRPRSRVHRDALYDLEDADTASSLLSRSAQSANLLRRWADLEARRLVEESWYAVEALAGVLLERETMPGDDVMQFLGEVDDKHRQAMAAARALLQPQGFLSTADLLEEMDTRRRREKPVMHHHMANSVLRVVLDYMARGDTGSIDLAEIERAVGWDLCARGFDEQAVAARLKGMIERRKPVAGWRRSHAPR